MNKLWNIKLCKELCPPTESYKRTGVPSTARDSLRFALSSMNLSRWLLLPSKSLHVEKNVVIIRPSKCVFSLGLHSYHRAVFLLTKLLQQVLTDISRLLRQTCSSGSSTLSTPTRALWLVPVIWASVAKNGSIFSSFLLVPTYWQYYCNLHNLMIERDQLNIEHVTMSQVRWRLMHSISRRGASWTPSYSRRCTLCSASPWHSSPSPPGWALSHFTR